MQQKRTWMEVASQAAIFASALSMLAIGDGNPWGFVAALAAQPFWYYTTISHKQWGIVAAGVIYTCAWVLGVYRNWDFFLGFF